MVDGLKVLGWRETRQDEGDLLVAGCSCTLPSIVPNAVDGLWRRKFVSGTGFVVPAVFRSSKNQSKPDVSELSDDAKVFVNWLYSDQPGLDLKFADFKPEATTEAAQFLIGCWRKELADYEVWLQSQHHLHWNQVVERYENIYRHAKRFEYLVELLAITQINKWSGSYDAVIDDLNTFSAKLSQSRVIYDVVNTFPEKRLSESERRERRTILVAAENYGVNIPAEKQEQNLLQKTAIQSAQSQIANQLSADKAAVALVLTANDQISGLPDDVLVMASDAYNKKFPDAPGEAQNGPWLITWDQLAPVLIWADSESTRTNALDLRRSLGKAADQTFVDLIANRQSSAKLLEYANYGDSARFDNLVSDGDEVREFLDPFWQLTSQAYNKLYAEIESYAQSQGAQGLTAENCLYWQNKWLLSQDYPAEAIRAKLTLDTCLDKLFGDTQACFGVTIERLPSENLGLPEGTQRYRMLQKGATLGVFDLDLKARSDKDASDFNYTIVSRENDKHGNPEQVAYAYISMNLSLDEQGNCALTPAQVRSIAHEFTHFLQAALYERQGLLLSGVNNMEPDATEIASMFGTLVFGENVIEGLLASDQGLLQAYQTQRTREQLMYYARQAMWAKFDFDVYDTPMASADAIDGLFVDLNTQMKAFVATDGPDETWRTFPHPFLLDKGGIYARYLRSGAVAMNYRAYLQSLRDEGASETEIGAAILPLFAYGSAKDSRAVYQEITGNTLFSDPRGFAAWMGLEWQQP